VLSEYKISHFWSLNNTKCQKTSLGLGETFRSSLAETETQKNPRLSVSVSSQSRLVQSLGSQNSNNKAKNHFIYVIKLYCCIKTYKLLLIQAEIMYIYLCIMNVYINLDVSSLASCAKELIYDSQYLVDD